MSTTVIVCTQVDELLLASVAVQVLVITSVLPQPETEVSEKVTAGDGSQTSVAVAVPVFAGEVSSPHSTVTLAGHEITGAVVSVPLGITMGLLPHVSLHPASPVSTTVTSYEFGDRLRNTPFETCVIVRTRWISWSY